MSIESMHGPHLEIILVRGMSGRVPHSYNMPCRHTCAEKHQILLGKFRIESGRTSTSSLRSCLATLAAIQLKLPGASHQTLSATMQEVLSMQMTLQQSTRITRLLGG